MATANEGDRQRVYAEMLGVDEYIRKPFSMDKLLESVKSLYQNLTNPWKTDDFQ